MHKPTVGVVRYLRKKPTPSYTSSCVTRFWTFLWFLCWTMGLFFLGTWCFNLAQLVTLLYPELQNWFQNFNAGVISKRLLPNAASSSLLAASGSDLPPVSFFKKSISISASPYITLVFIIVIGCQLYMSVESSQAEEWVVTQIMQFPAQSTEFPCRPNGGKKQFMVTATWVIFIAQSLDASVKP